MAGVGNRPQQRRCLSHPQQEGTFCVSDVGIPDEDAGALSDARVISTNEHWLRLHKAYSFDRDLNNQHLRVVCMHQKELIAMNSHPEAVDSIVRNAWKQELSEAITAFCFFRKEYQEKPLQ